MEEGTDESINVWKSWKVTVQSLLAFTLQVCEMSAYRIAYPSQLL